MTLKPKIGQFRGSELGKMVNGYFVGYSNRECPLIQSPGSNLQCEIPPESLGMYTGQFAKISPELAAAQPWRDVCPETGMTEIVGGYGPGVERGGDWLAMFSEHDSETLIYEVKFIGSCFVLESEGYAEPIYNIVPGFFNKCEIIGTAWEGK